MVLIPLLHFAVLGFLTALLVLPAVRVGLLLLDVRRYGRHDSGKEHGRRIRTVLRKQFGNPFMWVLLVIAAVAWFFLLWTAPLALARLGPNEIAVVLEFILSLVAGMALGWWGALRLAAWHVGVAGVLAAIALALAGTPAPSSGDAAQVEALPTIAAPKPQWGYIELRDGSLYQVVSESVHAFDDFTAAELGVDVGEPLELTSGPATEYQLWVRPAGDTIVSPAIASADQLAIDGAENLAVKSKKDHLGVHLDGESWPLVEGNTLGVAAELLWIRGPEGSSLRRPASAWLGSHMYEDGIVEQGNFRPCPDCSRAD